MINWYPGHMAKTKREIKENLGFIDIVFEVVDSRMPLSSRIKDLDEIISGKPRILIMTKYDLCDCVETDKLAKFYESKGYKIITVDLMNGKNVGKILNTTNEILAEMNEKRKAKGLKPRSARALIVGAPNVGKSTLINRLVGKKATNVGNKPGITKHLEWIRIHDSLELLDTPGILWPKLDNQHQAKILACLSSIKEEILDKEELAIFVLEILSKLYPHKLEERYSLTNIDFDDIEQTLILIATKRGALRKGGIADYDKVYNIILTDIRDNIKDITLDRL